MTKILIICGPTATGKTQLAANLAKKFSGELISADSRQVYQEMDIVTGKDQPKGVKIHGLDLVKPDEEFSVAHFVKYAVGLINQIIKRKKLPIVVGGTGLYINSLIKPPKTLLVKPDWRLRKQLDKIINSSGPKKLIIPCGNYLLTDSINLTNINPLTEDFFMPQVEGIRVNRAYFNERMDRQGDSV